MKLKRKEFYKSCAVFAFKNNISYRNSKMFMAANRKNVGEFIFEIIGERLEKDYKVNKQNLTEDVLEYLIKDILNDKYKNHKNINIPTQNNTWISYNSTK
jgi:hypothetical protein